VKLWISIGSSSNDWGEIISVFWVSSSCSWENTSDSSVTGEGVADMDGNGIIGELFAEEDMERLTDDDDLVRDGDGESQRVKDF
jgi:hypothetical protein